MRWQNRLLATACALVLLYTLLPTGMVASAAAAPIPQENYTRPDMRINQIQSAILVDGVLEDTWEKEATKISFTKDSLKKMGLLWSQSNDGTTWEPLSEDGEGIAYIGWSEQYFYFALKVEDSENINNCQNNWDLWKGDCLQMQIGADTLGMNTYDEDPGSVVRYEFGFAKSSIGTKPARGYQWRPLEQNIPSSIGYAVVHESGFTTYEIAIPYHAFGRETEMEKGDSIPFSFCLHLNSDNPNDSSDNGWFLEWARGTIGGDFSGSTSGKVDPYFGYKNIGSAARLTLAGPKSEDDLPFLYLLNEDSTATITRYYGSDSHLTIPSEMDGFPITGIASNTFAGCDTLQTVSIPANVEIIDDRAFADCTSLTRITLPDTLIAIGSEAFLGCSSLQNFRIPDSVVIIGDLAFADCTSLTVVRIPTGVFQIDAETFAGCTALRNVVIPDGVIAIGDQAFADCASLTDVTIPDTLTTIGNEAFFGCSSLRSILIPDSALFIGDRTFAKCTAMTGAAVSASVIGIGDQAFSGCPLTIYGDKDSYAQEYAKEWDIPFSTEMLKKSVATDIASAEGLNGVQFAFNVLLVTEQLDPAAELSESTALLLAGKNLTQYSLFDITLQQDYDEIQPEGRVKVSLTVPDGYNGEQCHVFRVEADGTLTDMEAICDNGQMLFATERFGRYIVAQGGSILGDVNHDGVVNTTDARLVLQYAVKKIDESALAVTTADVNGDSEVNTTDARLILQRAVNKIAKFPIE